MSKKQKGDFGGKGVLILRGFWGRKQVRSPLVEGMKRFWKRTGDNLKNKLANITVK